jgi:capping protein (actin filament) muscle Z-line, beta
VPCVRSSPWSNKYDPPIEDGDGFVPSDALRPLEMQFNEVFDAYRNLYFEGGVSSVYLWDLPEGFAGCFLIKKGAFLLLALQPRLCAALSPTRRLPLTCPFRSHLSHLSWCPPADVAGQRFVRDGSWDSIHVMEVKETADKKRATYKLTTTVMLTMKVEKDAIGDSDLSGSLTRQEERTCDLNVENTHISNMGKLIEDLEISMRSNMDGIYIQKTREVVNGIRKMHPGGPQQGGAFIADLSGAILKHGANRKQDSE